jgi:Nuclear transport factor 2 (NTF2) domain
MTYLETSLAAAGITKPAIVAYFTTINQAEFSKTTALFAENGSLLAPFTKPIIGRANITAYLTQEAGGMKLLPQQEICETESDCEKYQIYGKVKTALFSVNVAWYFTFNPENQISTVQVKLLASPQELLSLQSKQEMNSTPK